MLLFLKAEKFEKKKQIGDYFYVTVIHNANKSTTSASANANQSSEDKGSTISISELKDLQNDNMPNKTKRKPKSERNTISLDI